LGGSLARRTQKTSKSSDTPITIGSSHSSDHVSAEDDGHHDARVIYLDGHSGDGHSGKTAADPEEAHRVVYLDESTRALPTPSDGEFGDGQKYSLIDIDVVSPAPVILTPHQKIALEEAIEEDDENGAYARFGKRMLDVLLIMLGAPLWLPLYALAALVLLACQGRPIHYRQERVGRDGSSFSIVKFRTMRSSADAELMEILLRDPGLDNEYRTNVKLRTDPRVTAVGSFFRRWSLDELPQLWNVLAGQMCLVGPRPVRRGEWNNCYGGLALHVFRYGPGMTGMWQTCRNSFTTYEERVYLDALYTVRCNPITDLKILGATIPSMIGGDGSF
jgi:exopolysaccharide production protein ExoY